MKVDLKLIGEKIKSARSRCGISQAELADRIGVATSYLSKIENGQAKFGVDILVRLSEELQVSADALLRPDTPSANAIYASEYDEILKGSTASEKEAMLNILRSIKELSDKNN